jgi:hypothetical protein
VFEKLLPTPDLAQAVRWIETMVCRHYLFAIRLSWPSSSKSCSPAQIQKRMKMNEMHRYAILKLQSLFSRGVGGLFFWANKLGVFEKNISLLFSFLISFTF